MGSIFRLELGWRHSEGQAVSPIKKAARHIIWQHFFFFFFLPPLAWHRHSNLEELISGRDGSHDFSDPRLIKPPYQNTGSWEEGVEGIQGRQKSCLPHPLQDKLKPQRNKS